MTHTRQVFLTTRDLDLVLLEPDDAATLAHWFNDHEVTKYLARGMFPMTVSDETKYLEAVYQKPDKLQLGIWHRADNKLIGTTGLHRIDDLHRQGEFGIVIGDKAYWGSGLGTQTLTAMLDWSFRIRGLRSVTLRVLGNNPRGRRCYEKCGFTLAGSYPKHIFKNGAWVDEHHMVAHGPEWS